MRARHQLIRRQQSGNFYQWDIDRIDAAARLFDELSRELNYLFYHKLSDPDLLKRLNDNIPLDPDEP